MAPPRNADNSGRVKLSAYLPGSHSSKWIRRLFLGDIEMLPHFVTCYCSRVSTPTALRRARLIEPAMLSHLL